MRKSVFNSRDGKVQQAAVKRFADGGITPQSSAYSFLGNLNNWNTNNPVPAEPIYSWRRNPIDTTPVGVRNTTAPMAPTSVITPKAAITGVVPPTNSFDTKRNNVFSKFGDIVPYVSNLVNSFRRAPLPNAPGLNKPISARRVNYDNQRAEADRMTRGANVNLDRTLDENTAAAAKATGLASNIRAKNSIAEAESNTNAQLQADADRTNAAIEMQNTGLDNQWKQNLVEAQVANQREQSANLANAADKYIAQQDNKGRMDLDVLKWNTMKPVWDNSGVADRKFGEDTEWAKNLQATNPALYERMYRRAYGGKLTRKPVFKA